MTPSKRAKELGCKSLAQVANKTKQSEQTLINWFKNKPELFDVVCLGVSSERIKQVADAQRSALKGMSKVENRSAKLSEENNEFKDEVFNLRKSVNTLSAENSKLKRKQKRAENKS